jgi:hypothetical protein
VFLVGCYLSVAAMVAIPALQHQEADPTITKERLQAALQTADLSTADFDRQYPENYGADKNPLAALDAFLDTLPTALAPSAPEASIPAANQAEWAAKLSEVREALGQARTRRQAQLARWQDFRRRLSAQHASLVSRALSSFDIDTLSPLVGQERILYFQDVLGWHRGSLEELQRSLRQAMQYLDYYDLRLQQAGVATRDALPAFADSLRPAAGGPAGSSRGWDGGIDSAVQRLRQIEAEIEATVGRTFVEPEFAASQPTPPDPGTFAGPFGFIARWLLRTRSYSLALITGMMGFGLFGASIASIIRHDPKKFPLDDTRRLASRAIIQGLSAAVVIFLAVQGGLAVFAAGVREPNGYIVCFTCLVSAVFSEQVWEWAGRKLREMINGGDSGKDDSSKGRKPEAEDPADTKTK